MSNIPDAANNSMTGNTQAVRQIPVDVTARLTDISDKTQQLTLAAQFGRGLSADQIAVLCGEMVRAAIADYEDKAAAKLRKS